MKPIVYTTLLPGKSGAALFEKGIVSSLLETALYREIEPSDIPEVVLFSAYEDVLKETAAAVRKAAPDLSISTQVCPFQFRENMTEKRGHEISCCKQYTEEWLIENRKDAVQVFVDSDVWLSWLPVSRAVRSMKEGECVSFPYCLRNTDHAPPEQFGAFALHVSDLDQKAVRRIYTTQFLPTGELARRGAPDCNLLFALQEKGIKLLRKEHLYSEHYSRGGDRGDGVYVYCYGYCGRRHLHTGVCGNLFEDVP